MVIVTGGAGFIGSNLIDLLIKKNYFVINVDKVTYSSNFYNIKENKKSNKYKFIKCNIGEKKSQTNSEKDILPPNTLPPSRCGF